MRSATAWKCISFVYVGWWTRMNLVGENSIGIHNRIKIFQCIIHLFTHSICSALNVIWFLCLHIRRHCQAHLHIKLYTHTHSHKYIYTISCPFSMYNGGKQYPLEESACIDDNQQIARFHNRNMFQLVSLLIFFFILLTLLEWS